MFCHLILGLLRDGRPRHAYEMVSEYRAWSARPINSGNVYRECGKLASQRLIAADANPPDADPRRIPYRITEMGCREFDSWLLAPSPLDGALSSWILFADMLSPADRMRLIDRMQQEVWEENKKLVRARESMLARNSHLNTGRYRPAAFILVHRIKQTSAQLEFLEELRRELEHAPPGRVVVSVATNGSRGRRDR